MRLTLLQGALTIVVIALIAVGAARLRRAPSSATHPTASVTPLAHRVTVEVINAGRVAGAARVATVLLRGEGLDVVYYGGVDSARGFRAHGQVVVRRGDTTGVGRVVRTLGITDVVSAPDSTREADLSVWLGRDFAPPRP